MCVYVCMHVHEYIYIYTCVHIELYVNNVQKMMVLVVNGQWRSVDAPRFVGGSASLNEAS